MNLGQVYDYGKINDAHACVLHFHLESYKCKKILKKNKFFPQQNYQ